MSLSEVVSAYLSLIVVIAVSSTVAAFTALTYMHSQSEVLKSSIWLAAWKIEPNKILVKNIGTLDVLVEAAVLETGKIEKIGKIVHKGQIVQIETRKPIAGLKACIPGTQICTYLKISQSETTSIRKTSTIIQLENKQQQRTITTTHNNNRNTAVRYTRHTASSHRAHRTTRYKVFRGLIIYLNKREEKKTIQQETQTRKTSTHTVKREESREKKTETEHTQSKSTETRREEKNREKVERIKVTSTQNKNQRKTTETTSRKPKVMISRLDHLYFDFETKTTPVLLGKLLSEKSKQKQQEHTQRTTYSSHRWTLFSTLRQVLVCKVFTLDEWEREKERYLKEGFTPMGYW